MTATAAPPSTWSLRWQRFASACVRGFHAYGNWLVGISWKRFFLLSLLLLIGAALLQNIPPFSWTYTETVIAPAKKKRDPVIRIEKDKRNSDGVDITIDERGIRITPKPAPAAKPSTGTPASGAASAAASTPASTEAASAPAPIVDIRLPPGVAADAVKSAVDETRQAIEEAIREARIDAREAAADARQAARDAADAAAPAASTEKHTRVVHVGSSLPEFALLWILASALIKITYRQTIRAEAQAAQAVETAEAESLKRQVVEARMAAMQAQVEPHFLFNTLASIDHLIEVDPKRASLMQKNLIALLRASMPTMREAGDGGSRDLGRELSMIRPYLEILKVRMEERLATEIDVPEGLLSAEFPQMMLQTLVENAVKHGLEPKPEGGRLKVGAEIVHGKLAVTVTDTGLGFGRAATAGTGVGLANIRERLQLLYGGKGALTISENPEGGTIATVTVPYKPLNGDSA